MIDEDDEVAELELPRDDWAYDVVLAAAFRHVRDDAACVGAATVTTGRARCACGWQLSGRMSDRGERSSARFAMCALATIGLAIAVAMGAP